MSHPIPLTLASHLKGGHESLTSTPMGEVRTQGLSIVNTRANTGAFYSGVSKEWRV